MKSFPPELIFVLIFAAVLVVKFLMEKAARLRRAGSRPQPPPEDDEIAESEWNAARIAVLPPSQPQQEPAWMARRGDATPVASAHPRRRLRVARQALFGARWDLQEAIVVATILGRCRADEPHDIK